MGWSIHYQAKIPRNQVDAFLQEANSVPLVLAENCENYKWESNDKGLVSGITKVHYSKAPEKDFITILYAIKSLSEKWAKIKFVVSDDYYLQGEDIRKVNIANVLEPPKPAENKPFNLDEYVFEYEIPTGLTVKIESLIDSIDNKELAERARRSISAWKACGAIEIYARKFMFKSYVKDINNEMIFLIIPDGKVERQKFFGALCNLYGKEIIIPEDKRILATFLLK